MPAMDISKGAVHVDNAILGDDLTWEVALEKHKIRNRNQNFRIGNNCMDDGKSLGIPGGSFVYADESDET